MNSQVVSAIIRRELRSMQVPAFGAVIVYGFLVMLSHQDISGSAPKIPELIWLIFGMAAGAGMIARDRRLGFSPLVNTLPVNRNVCLSIRFFTRLAIAVAVAILLVTGRYFFEDWFGGAGDPQIADRAEVMIATMTGFGFTIPVSAMVKRESIAFGGGFLAALLAMGFFFGTIAFHPYYSILPVTVYEVRNLAVLVLLGGALCSLLQASKARDPGSRIETRRAVIPLLAACLGSGFLFYYEPFRLAALPLAEMDHVRWLGLLPGSDDFLLYGVKDIRSPRHGRFGVSLWRCGDLDGVRLYGPDVIGVNPSPDGSHIMIKTSPKWLWQPGFRLRLLSAKGELIWTSEPEGFSYRKGHWSPDGTCFAIPERRDDTLGIRFLNIHSMENDTFWDKRQVDSISGPQIFSAGWLSNSEYLCFLGYGKLKKLILIQLNGDWREIWTGSISQIFEGSCYISEARRSILFTAKQGENSDSYRVVEVFVDQASPVHYNACGEFYSIYGDDHGRKILTTCNEDYDSDFCTTLLSYDLFTGLSSQYRIPLSDHLMMSSDGHFAVARIINVKHKDRFNLILIDLISGQQKILDTRVRLPLAWSGKDRLVVSMSPGGIGILDVSSGHLDRVLDLPLTGGVI